MERGYESAKTNLKVFNANYDGIDWSSVGKTKNVEVEEVQVRGVIVDKTYNLDDKNAPAQLVMDIAMKATGAKGRLHVVATILE